MLSTILICIIVLLAVALFVTRHQYKSQRSLALGFRAALLHTEDNLRAADRKHAHWVKSYRSVLIKNRHLRADNVALNAYNSRLVRQLDDFTVKHAQAVLGGTLLDSAPADKIDQT